VPKPVEFILLVWHFVVDMLPPGDKPQIEGPLTRGVWRHGITARRSGAQFCLATFRERQAIV